MGPRRTHRGTPRTPRRTRHLRGEKKYRDAAAHAGRAGDDSSCCNLLGQISRVLADLGHYDEALAFADRALQLADTRAHPAVRCWLHAVRAHHQARLADHASARSDLDAAWHLFSRAEDGEKPPYISYLSEAELNKWTGHTAVALAETDRTALHTGRQALEAALTAWPSPMVRGSAAVLTASARMSIAHHNLDQAQNLIDQAISIAAATSSTRNLQAALHTRAIILAKA
ncbi:hypothetical protein [Streptomyces canarius]|uniref:hypothetical protein n=1 Tax=Streptomyces canarius TaxID=285453 RepID=UPI001674A645|nr:hypothetical protein [Streptomyces canarius]